jgi:hypothetical protein
MARSGAQAYQGARILYYVIFSNWGMEITRATTAFTNVKLTNSTIDTTLNVFHMGAAHLKTP